MLILRPRASMNWKESACPPIPHHPVLQFRTTPAGTQHRVKSGWALIRFFLLLLVVLFCSVSAFVQRVIRTSDQSEILAQHLKVFNVALMENYFHIAGQISSRFLSLCAISREAGVPRACTWELQYLLCAACCCLSHARCAGVWDIPAGEENCSRTLLQPSVMMNDCFPTRLHSVSLETEHLNTLASSPTKTDKEGRKS